MYSRNFLFMYSFCFCFCSFAHQILPATCLKILDQSHQHRVRTNRLFRVTTLNKTKTTMVEPNAKPQVCQYDPCRAASGHICAGIISAIPHTRAGQEISLPIGKQIRNGEITVPFAHLPCTQSRRRGVIVQLITNRVQTEYDVSASTKRDRISYTL
ncbi:hypothetical protein BKA67DRAFT_645100 [Truncatella angustata]|uniref:Secreted protein n=1 Tax=Truncatella angustata TaxID=152316 RepID=A0A9P8ZYX9_9PEZI|nr:uncharacterized protein BKA67DRAFT_645100 [Truncatella angustata]KAH6655627.1 hypothetical protein BKA67DRAFT_645100 [Truncatella angustata]